LLEVRRPPQLMLSLCLASVQGRQLPLSLLVLALVLLLLVLQHRLLPFSSP
jgi:hypothetical protein